METRGRRSLIWTGVGICMMSCCITCIIGDVPDGFVYTDLLKTIPRGSTAVLKCEFFGPPLAVYWKKGDNPKQASTLITWMDEQIWPGLCAVDNSCERGDDNSLIIRDVQIEDEGRYICRVSNHQGILIHNFTDLKVFEPPREPYPVINECNDSSALEKDYGCDISTLNNLILTCSASSFFPDLDLFFLHGTEKITTTETNEWTNNDGTKSKSVTIDAAPKETPYVCVASDLPGNEKERAITVFVRLLHVDTSTASTWSTSIPSKDLNVVIIFVPLVFVTITGVCILIVCWRRHRRQDSNRCDQEEGSPLLALMTIEGKLSFYDLWMMLSRVTTSETEKLNDTLYELGLEKLMKGSKPLEAYPHLCQWKTDNVDADQADILKKALDKSSYHGAWEEIWGLQRISAIVLSEGTLEHILWHIGEPGKINKFLSELIPGRPTTQFEVTDGISKLVQEPLRELKKWSVGTTDENPVLLLSLALERAGYSPLDRTFFCVPDLPVSSDVVQQFGQKLTSRHFSRLAKLTPYEIESIVDDNNRDLFDTESMISDWVAQENGSLENTSHIDMRCKLDHAAISIGRYDLKGYLVGYNIQISLSDTGEKEQTGHGEEGQGNDHLGNDLSDTEIQRIIRYLDKEQLSEIIGEHLEGDSFKTIKAWIEKESSASQPDSCRQRLRAKLSPIGKEGLIPLEIKEDVCLVELVDIAFRLMMMDIYPLAEALDISADKLKSYKRQSRNKSKLSKGTMGVLVRLGEKTNFTRSKMCDVLVQTASLQEMAHLMKYGYDLSRSDLCAVGYGVGSEKEQCAKISENLGITTKETFTMNVLGHWRSLVKSSTCNPRTALADAVLPVLGKEKAFDIISGKSRHSNFQKGNIIPFIRDSIEYVQAFNLTRVIGVQRSCSETGELTFKQVLEIWRESLKNKPLKDNQRGELCKRLDSGGFKTFSSKLHHGDYKHVENGDIIEEMEKAIIHDVAENVSEILDAKVKSFQGKLTIKQVLEEWKEKVRKKPLEQQEHIILSNRLFKEGYKDFSFEVMIGFVPKPLEPKEATNNDGTLTIQSVVV